MALKTGVRGEFKPRRRHVTLDRLALAAGAPITTVPRAQVLRKARGSTAQLPAPIDPAAHTTATPTSRSADPGAYNGRTPGGRFVQSNPGKPPGARDRAPRAPRFWKELMATMDAGVVRFHVPSQRYVLFNPMTEEPLTGADGNWVYDPTYDDVAAAAILYGALQPQKTAKFTEYWLRYVKETAAAKSREVSRSRRNRRAPRRTRS